MTNLSNKQISEVINRFYTSTNFIRIITNVVQKLEINGLLIEGDIIVNKNVNVDGEIRNNIISFTEIEKKIDMLEDKRIIRVTSTPFREITLNTGNPYVKDIIENVWYWIFAAHYGSQFIWGFFLSKINNKTTLNFYNNNMKNNHRTNNLFSMNCLRPLIRNESLNKEGHNEWGFLPIDSNNFGIPYLIKVIKYFDWVNLYQDNIVIPLNKKKISDEFIFISSEPVNSLNLPNKIDFQKNQIFGGGTDLVNNYGCTIRQDDLPSTDVSFFEGWKNSKLPFKQMKNTNYDWRSAFDLYKNSTNVPSISIQ